MNILHRDREQRNGSIILANGNMKLKKFIPISDGLESFERARNSRLEEIEKWRIARMKEVAIAESLKKTEEQEKIKARALAKFQVKYDLPATSDWANVWYHADEKFQADLEEIQQFYGTNW